MQPTAFSCPHCRTRLRIRDRSQVGRTIDCPDCGQPLTLSSDSMGRIMVEAAAGHLPAVLPIPRPAWSVQRRSPVVVAWTSVAAAAALILWIVLRDDAATDVASVAPSPVPDPVASVTREEGNSPAAPASEPNAEDDLPLSPELAAEGDVAGNAATLVPLPEVTDPADERPIDVSLAEDLPHIDVDLQLAQPILEFSQERPVAARRLFQLVAEMSAVPIDVGEVEIDPWAERLDEEKTLVFKETTVGGLLTAVLELTGLRMEVRSGVIHVLPPAPGSVSD